MHPSCTKAQALAIALRAELERVQRNALHGWRHDADLYEVGVIIEHLAETSADLHAIVRTAS